MIKKIDVFFIIIFLFLFLFLALNPDPMNITNDSINYINNSLLINNFINNIDISLENITYYPILYPLILSFFLSGNDTINLLSCLESIQNCILYLDNIFYIHLLLFFISVTFVFLIAQKLFCNKVISYISSFLFFLNSYYFSRIFFISPEILAIFLFVLSFYLIIIFLENNNTILFFLLIFFSSFLILVKPIFLIINFIFFCYLFIFKKIDFKKLIISLIIILSFFQLSSLIKIKLTKNNIYNYEFTVLEQRTAYGTINYNEIFPLFISFTPKIGNLILEKFFDKEKIERVRISKNSRNYFYNNRDKLNQKIDFKLSKSKIVIKNLKNIDKQILLTPIFLFRGIFMQSGLSDYYIKYQNSSLVMIYIYFNYIFFSLSKMYLFFISLKLAIQNKKDNLQIILFYPLVIFLTHAILTHNLPRYTSILFGIGAVFIVQKIYKIIINNYINKNV
jgi:hypothetical protein